MLAVGKGSCVGEGKDQRHLESRHHGGNSVRSLRKLLAWDCIAQLHFIGRQVELEQRVAELSRRVSKQILKSAAAPTSLETLTNPFPLRTFFVCQVATGLKATSRS
eukprot:4288248-Amphidinium_carterae.1